MKNMPSVVKEISNKTSPSISGKRVQKGRQLASVSGPDLISSPVASIFPVAFQRLFQDSLRVHDQAGIHRASLSGDVQEHEGALGLAQLTKPGSEKGMLLQGTKSRGVKGRSISAPSRGKAGKKTAAEVSPKAHPNVAVSFPNISLVDNREHAPRGAQESTGGRLRLDGHGDVPVRRQSASGKTQDHLRSGFRHIREDSAVRGEKGTLSKSPAIAETGGDAEREQMSGIDAVARSIRGLDTTDHQADNGPSDDAPALGEGSGKRAPTAPEVKIPPLSNGPAVRLQRAFGRTDDHLRPGHPYASESAAASEGKDDSFKHGATAGIDGTAMTRLLDETAEMDRGVRGIDTRHERERARHTNDSPLSSLLGEGSGKRAGVALRKKTSIVSADAAVPAADAAMISSASGETGTPSAELLHTVSERVPGHLRSGRRHTAESLAVAGDKDGPDRSAAILETEGDGKTVPADAVDDAARGFHGAETGRHKENRGPSDGAASPSLPKESMPEYLRRAVMSEKASLISTASAVPAAGTAPISVGSEDAGGVLSPGRQALLMAEVVDTARPLVQQGGGRIRISLSPPSLGALEIEVRVKKEGVELFMVANNADVQQTLCSHVDQLRKALVEQGLSMDRFQVVVGDRPDGQPGRDSRQEGMAGGHREAWNERGYLPGLDGDTMNDEMGNSALSGAHPSVGAINLFI